MKGLNIKAYAAEFIGTLALVLFACGVAAYTGGSLLVTAVAFGLVLAVLILVIGPISGCHVNPAVSIAMLINKKLSVKDFCFYLAAQVLGAIAGAALLLLFTTQLAPAAFIGLGTNAIAVNFTAVEAIVALLVELVLTFVFVYIIVDTVNKNKSNGAAALSIGGTLTLVHLLGINLTGTSVNPARSIGPALFAGGDALSSLWIFILAPLVGAILAAVAYKWIRPEVK